MKKRLLLSLANIFALCVVIAAVSLYFIRDQEWMGEILIGLGILCLVSLLPFGIRPKYMIPDLFFGIVDNGILAIMAILGASFAGVGGAILGGVVGNTITDGIAGIFEGYVSEKFDAGDGTVARSMLTSAVGKMAGCLFGAGAVLSLARLAQW